VVTAAASPSPAEPAEAAAAAPSVVEAPPLIDFESRMAEMDRDDPDEDGIDAADAGGGASTTPASSQARTRLEEAIERTAKAAAKRRQQQEEDDEGQRSTGMQGSGDCEIVRCSSFAPAFVWVACVQSPPMSRSPPSRVRAPLPSTAA
jgi:hypothetical protein